MSTTTPPVEKVTFSNIVKRFPALLAEAAKLKSPALDAGILAVIIAVVSPFGLNVGPDGAIVTGALVAVGTVAAAVEAAIKDIKGK